MIVPKEIASKALISFFTGMSWGLESMITRCKVANDTSGCSCGSLNA
jgi:hypothetical protein